VTAKTLESTYVRYRIMSTSKYQDYKVLLRMNFSRFGVSFDTHSVRTLAVCFCSESSNAEVALMHDPETYPWQAPYVSAVFETDERHRGGLLYEAIAAIEQRRLSPVPPEEEVALAGAEAGIQILISERTAKYV
jgi:hypothetical protein